jgi:gamma-glutamyltranspeptidase/glutathione hydrolase
MDPWIVEKREVIADNGIVSSAHRLASQAGVEMLMNGGNAVDAGAATSFAIGVVEPFMNGIGGGGVINIRLRSGEQCVVDGYVMAPRNVKDYDWTPALHKTACVPGILAAWSLALEKYGTMTLEEVTMPAIKYAKNGFLVDSYIEKAIASSLQRLNGAGVRLLCKSLYQPLKEGDLYFNKDLARSLELIAKGGPDEFYRGRIAEAIVEDMERNGGLITREDLASYKARTYEPVITAFRGHEVQLVPYAHGGMTVGHTLNILEQFKQEDLVYDSTKYYHILAEAEKRAFKDRLTYYGDPYFANVPWEGLLSKKYAAELSNEINLEKSSGVVEPGDPWKHDHSYAKSNPKLKSSYSGNVPDVEETTSFSVIDKDRNMVGGNQSLGKQFGSGVCVPGCGFFLNDWMFKATGASGFMPLPWHPTHIQAGKRPVNNHAPTVIYKNNQPFMVLGSPAGRRQQGAIIQTIVHVIDHGMGIQKAISAPRIHCEGNNLWMETRISEETRNALRSMGHEVIDMAEATMFFGGLNAVKVNQKTGKLHGGADIRRPCAAVGY